MRLVAISFTGRPFESLSSDGNFLYLLSHTSEHPFIKQRTKKGSLKKLISIPVSTSDIISLLSGTIPVYDYNYIEYDKNDNGFSISLFSYWYGLKEKIYFDRKNRIISVEFFSSSSNLIYRAVINKYKKINNFNIPDKLHIFSVNNSFKLDIQRFWANVPVSKDMFVLKPEGN